MTPVPIQLQPGDMGSAAAADDDLVQRRWAAAMRHEEKRVRELGILTPFDAQTLMGPPFCEGPRSPVQ